MSQIDATLAQLILAAMVLSMLAAPFVIQFSEPVVRRFTANDWLARAAQVTQIAVRTMARRAPRKAKTSAPSTSSLMTLGGGTRPSLTRLSSLRIGTVNFSTPMAPG